jgi:VanZ family protein
LKCITTLNEKSLNLNSDLVKFIRYWIPVIIWSILICWLSTATFSSNQSSRFIMPAIHFLFPWISPEGADLIHWVFRKTGHFTVYFIFGLLLFRAFCGDCLQGRRLRWAVYSMITLIFFAIMDEIHQSYVPSRTFLLSDVAIDITGGIFSQVVIAMSAKRKRSVITRRDDIRETNSLF